MKNYTIVDRRENKKEPVGYVVANDRFLSGWGGAAGGRSLIAYAYHDHNEMVARFNHCKRRSDFAYVRDNMHLPRLYDNDHLVIHDAAF